jgi:hypothetical protein
MCEDVDCKLCGLVDGIHLAENRVSYFYGNKPCDITKGGFLGWLSGSFKQLLCVTVLSLCRSVSALRYELMNAASGSE